MIERVAYRPLRNAPRLAPLISAIGVSLILEDVGKLWKGITIVSFPQIFPQKFLLYRIYEFQQCINILVIVVAPVLMVGLQWMVTRTRTGRAMRAVAQDREAAALMGVNVNRIIAITFFIGAAPCRSGWINLRLAIRQYQFHAWFYTWSLCFYSGGTWRYWQPCWCNAWRSTDRCDRGASYPHLRFYSTRLPIGLPHGGAAWHEAIIFVVLILDIGISTFWSPWSADT